MGNTCDAGPSLLSFEFLVLCWIIYGLTSDMWDERVSNGVILMLTINLDALEWLKIKLEKFEEKMEFEN